MDDDSLSMPDDADVGYVLGENLKTLSLALKSAEEIERLTLAEGQFYNEIDRALYLLAPERLSVQRLSVVNNLPTLLRDYKDEAAEKLLPKILSALGPGGPTGSGSGGGGGSSSGGGAGSSEGRKKELSEYQMAVGTMLCRLVNERLLPLRLVSSLVVPRALHLLLAASSPGSLLMAVGGAMGGKSSGGMPLSLLGGGGSSSSLIAGPKVAACWLDTLFACIDACPPDVLKDQVIPWATARGQVTEPTPSRLLSCKVLGRLASRLEAATIEATYFNLAISLCQDTSYEVRSCMCEQLRLIARGVGVETSTRVILAELKDLLNDEEPDVIRAAFSCYVSLLEFFDARTVTETMVPLLRAFCRSPPNTGGGALYSASSSDSAGGGGGGGSGDSLLVIAENFGRLLVLAADKLTDEELTEFCLVFRGLCKAPSPAVRFQCAFNMPAVAKMATEKKFTAHLQDVYAALVADPSADVRHSIAASFPVVAELLGPRAARFLRPLLLQLLRDPSTPVKEVLAAHIRELLDYFCRAGEEPPTPHAAAASSSGSGSQQQQQASSQQQPVSSLLGPVLELQPALSSSWRLLTPFVEQLADFHKFFPPASIMEKLIPLLLRLLAGNPMVPVKRAAITALCRLMRYSVRSMVRRRDLCLRLIAEFGPRGGRSAWQRQLFVEIAGGIALEFSRRFFNALFADCVIDLANDPVATVRLKLCRFVPELKRMIRLPHDAQLMKRLKMCTNGLCNDPDRDVAQTAHWANHLLDAYPDTAQLLRRPSPDALDEEEDNRRKEEDEEALARLEERDADEARRREEEARIEFRRKLAEKEQEISMKAKIFGNKRTTAAAGGGGSSGPGGRGGGGGGGGMPSYSFGGGGAFSSAGSSMSDGRSGGGLSARRTGGSGVTKGGSGSSSSSGSMQPQQQSAAAPSMPKQRSYKDYNGGGGSMLTPEAPSGTRAGPASVSSSSRTAAAGGGGSSSMSASSMSGGMMSMMMGGGGGSNASLLGGGPKSGGAGGLTRGIDSGAGPPGSVDSSQQPPIERTSSVVHTPPIGRSRSGSTSGGSQSSAAADAASSKYGSGGGGGGGMGGSTMASSSRTQQQQPPANVSLPKLSQAASAPGVGGSSSKSSAAAASLSSGPGRPRRNSADAHEYRGSTLLGGSGMASPHTKAPVTPTGARLIGGGIF